MKKGLRKILLEHIREHGYILYPTMIDICNQRFYKAETASRIMRKLTEQGIVKPEYRGNYISRWILRNSEPDTKKEVKAPPEPILGELRHTQTLIDNFQKKLF